MEYKDLSPASLSEEQLRLLIDKRKTNNETEFPSERALSEKLGVSRTTLRRSLETLKQEGLIKKSGPKSMTINKKQTINMLAMSSMSKQLQKNEQSQYIFVIESGIKGGELKVNQFFGREEDKPLFKLMRKRVINHKTFMFEISYLDPDRFSNIESIDFTNQSLYHILETRFKAVPTYGREEICYLPADKEKAAILETELGTPLFEVISKAFDQNDEPIEYSEQYLIGDQVSYKISATNIFDYREDDHDG